MKNNIFTPDELKIILDAHHERRLRPALGENRHCVLECLYDRDRHDDFMYEEFERLHPGFLASRAYWPFDSCYHSDMTDEEVIALWEV